MTTLIFILISAIFKASMNFLAHSYTRNNKFWNPRISWVNKWKNGDPNQGEKFLFSSTILSFLTDGWHLLQLFFLNTIILSVVLYKPMFCWWIDFLIFSVSFRILFEIIYSSLKNSK